MDGFLLLFPSIAGFLHHVLRKDYGTFQLFSGEDHAQRGEMFFWGIVSFFRGAAEVGTNNLCSLELLGRWTSSGRVRRVAKRLRYARSESAQR